MTDRDIAALTLADVQPSQFYVSEEKLQRISDWFHPADLSNFDPIPVKLLDGTPVMTDGHTRAVAAILAGLDRVPLIPETDELNWEMYRLCVRVCRERNILSAYALLSRRIPASEYREKWDKWCERMQAEAAASEKERELCAES